MAFSLNENIPVEEIAKAYVETKIITIPNFLTPESAEELYQHVNTRDEWHISIHPYQHGIYTFNQTPDNEEFIQRGIMSANQARERGEFSYVFYRSDLHNDSCTCTLCNAIRFIQSKTVIDKINEITGENVTSAISIFASCYKKNFFLNAHTDNGRGKIAFVLNLTKDWDPNWGGSLNFYEWDFRTVKKTINPAFNSLSIFNVEGNGVPHAVTHIPSHVEGRRLALAGWFQ